MDNNTGKKMIAGIILTISLLVPFALVPSLPDPPRLHLSRIVYIMKLCLSPYVCFLSVMTVIYTSRLTFKGGKSMLRKILKRAGGVLLIAIFSLVALMFFLGIGEWIYLGPPPKIDKLEFDTKKWVSAGETKDYSFRLHLLDDLVEKHGVKGLGPEAVKKLLGEPDDRLYPRVYANNLLDDLGEKFGAEVLDLETAETLLGEPDDKSYPQVYAYKMGPDPLHEKGVDLWFLVVIDQKEKVRYFYYRWRKS